MKLELQVERLYRHTDKFNNVFFLLQFIFMDFDRKITIFFPIMFWNVCRIWRHSNYLNHLMLLSSVLSTRRCTLLRFLPATFFHPYLRCGFVARAAILTTESGISHEVLVTQSDSRFFFSKLEKKIRLFSFEI